MNRNSFTFKAMAFIVFALATTALVQAQATRTWVSGVGDDANPCSRTAPCKTFAGAISKTADPGEIDALDPGGYGAVTILKSVTIDGGGTLASVLNSGGNGIVVNGAGKIVTLRRIAIDGAGTTLGTHGVNAIAVGVLNIENCYIFNQSQEGILINLGTGANVNISDTIVKNDGQGGGATGAGIRANTSDAGSGTGHTIFLSIYNTRIDNNTEGLRIENNVRATAYNSSASNNSLNGFVMIPGGVASELNLDTCIASNNKQWGIFSGTNGTVRISLTTVANNLVQGLNPSGGSILSYNNNKVQGNGAGGANNGAPTGPAPQS